MSISRWLFALLLLLAPASHARADDAAPDDDEWVVSPDVGISIAPGTEDRWLVRGGLLATRAWEANEFSVGGEVVIGETKGETSSESFGARAAYRRLFTKRLFGGLSAEWLHDGQADLDSRATIAAALGGKLIATDTTTLALEAGPAYVLEEQNGSTSYLAARVAERFTLRLSERLSIWQSIEATPEVENLDNTLVTAEIGIETRLTDRISLRTSARNRWDGETPDGIDESDLAVFTSLALTMGAPPLSGDGDAPARPPSPWTSSAAFGFGLQQGNSETLSLTADWKGAYRRDSYELLLGATGGYGEEREVLSSQVGKGGAQFNWLLDGPLYIGTSANGQHDKVARIDYRVDLAPVVGGYLIRNDDTTLGLDLGPGYAFEELDTDERGYLTAVVGQRFTHRFGERLAVWESLRVVGEVEDFDNLRAEAEIGFDLRVTEGFGVRLGLQNSYQSEPAAGAKQNDIRLITGFTL